MHMLKGMFGRCHASMKSTYVAKSIRHSAMRQSSFDPRPSSMQLFNKFFSKDLSTGLGQMLVVKEILLA